MAVEGLSLTKVANFQTKFSFQEIFDTKRLCHIKRIFIEVQI